jgi:hypothetical protein
LLQYTTDERYARTAIPSPLKTRSVVRAHPGNPPRATKTTKMLRKIIAVFFVITIEYREKTEYSIVNN